MVRFGSKSVNIFSIYSISIAKHDTIIAWIIFLSFRTKLTRAKFSPYEKLRMKNSEFEFRCEIEML